MKIFLLIIISNLLSHAHSDLRDFYLHEKGVPNEFLELYGNYLDLSESLGHGADREEVEVKLQQTYEETRSLYPKKAGDYSLLIILHSDGMGNPLYTRVAYDFYEDVNIRSDKMLDFCRKSLISRDWVGDRIEGLSAKKQFLVLLREGDEKDITLVKEIRAKMDNVEVMNYGRMIDYFLENRLNGGGKPRPQSKLPSPIPSPKIGMKSEERRDSKVGETKTFDEGAGDERSNIFLWIALGVLSALATGFFFVRKSR